MKKNNYEKIKKAVEVIVKENGINSTFATKDVKSRLSDANPTSVILSDYCYNRTKKGIDFEDHMHMLEFVGGNKYVYLGIQYPYNGIVMYKPVGQKYEIALGNWINGVFTNYLKELIEEKAKEYAKNTNEFYVGQNVLDSDNTICTITNKTSNTIEIQLRRISVSGVNSTQWFCLNPL
jgi:hypothetical protein